MGTKYVEEVFGRLSVNTTFVFAPNPIVDGEADRGFRPDRDDEDDVPWRTKRNLVFADGQKMVRRIADDPCEIRSFTPGWLHYFEHRMLEERPAYQIDALFDLLIRSCMSWYMHFTNSLVVRDLTLDMQSIKNGLSLDELTRSGSKVKDPCP
jgi:hypothetical protein